MHDDDYRELAQNALDALRDLINASEPGIRVTPLNSAFTSIKDTIIAIDKRERKDAAQQESEQRRDEHAEWRRRYDEGRNAWRKLDREVKRGRILDALASDGLIRAEIVERICAAHPDTTVYESDLMSLLKQMMAGGDLRREKEARGPNHSVTAIGGYRWRWYRSAPNLSPELKSLQDRLDQAAG